MPFHTCDRSLHIVATRLRAAKRRVRYHSRPGHGASKTLLPSGEAKSLAMADVENLTSEYQKIRSLTAAHPGRS